MGLRSFAASLVHEVKNALSVMQTVAVAALVGGTGGCGSTISSADDLVDPVPVFIADHGIHSSIFMPSESGGVVQYGQSQYAWCAEDRDGFLRGPLALLIPDCAGLGRRFFGVEPEAGALLASAEIMDRHPAIETLYEVRVERALLEEVRRGLDERFLRSAGRGASGPEDELGTFNAKRGMYWVRCEGPDYWLGNNCNHSVNGWMRDLGCRVSGAGVSADFNVIGCRPRRRHGASDPGVAPRGWGY